MSVGNDLQEMENAVTKGAAKGDPIQKLTTGGTPATWEDLGGPTPENSKPTDDSNKLSTPGKTLAQVRNVVNKGAGKADPMKGLSTADALNSGDEVELKDDQEVVAEDEVTTDEVVAEEKHLPKKLSLKKRLLKRKLLQKKKLLRNQLSPKRRLMSKKTSMLLLLVKNFPKSSKTKHGQSLKLQLEAKLQLSRKSLKLPTKKNS